MAETAHFFHVWMQFHTQSNTQSFHYTMGDYFYAQLNASSSTLQRFSVSQLIITFNQTIHVLITFLQLKYQINQSPFSTHRGAMVVAVSGCIVSYLAYVALLRCEYDRLRSFARRCLVLSAHLSVASLTSVLLPDNCSPFVYAVFVLVSVSELLCFSFQLYVINAVFDACRMCVARFLRRYSRQPPHMILPF